MTLLGKEIKGPSFWTLALMYANRARLPTYDASNFPRSSRLRHSIPSTTSCRCADLDPTYTPIHYGARYRGQRDCHASYGTQEDWRLNAEVGSETTEYCRLLQEDAWSRSFIAFEDSFIQHRSQGVEHRRYACSQQCSCSFFKPAASTRVLTASACDQWS